MKIRQTLNNNAERFAATVFEHQNRIIVVKRDTFNYYDTSTDERFEFSSVAAYNEWLSHQDWVVPSKIEIAQRFINVPES